nr:hypothetical protein [Spirosomataceae bacterium]
MNYYPTPARTKNNLKVSRNLILVLLISLLAYACAAQVSQNETLTKIKCNGKYGFVSKSGQISIPC